MKTNGKFFGVLERLEKDGIIISNLKMFPYNNTLFIEKKKFKYIHVYMIYLGAGPVFGSHPTESMLHPSNL